LEFTQASEAKNGRKAVALRLPGREPLQIHGRYMETGDGKMRDQITHNPNRLATHQRDAECDGMMN